MITTRQVTHKIITKRRKTQHGKPVDSAERFCINTAFKSRNRNRINRSFYLAHGYIWCFGWFKKRQQTKAYKRFISGQNLVYLSYVALKVLIKIADNKKWWTSINPKMEVFNICSIKKNINEHQYWLPLRHEKKWYGIHPKKKYISISFWIYDTFNAEIT